MKYVIIEDEPIAASRLQNIIAKLRPSYQLMGLAESINRAEKLLSNSDIDLIFLDIQLSDGISFELFQKIEINKPIIFTTAYDEYAIRAFKVNSVDYLLKPINPEELEASIKKFEKHHTTSSHRSIPPELISNLLEKEFRSYKERFVIKIGEHLKSISVEDLSVIYADEKTTYIHARDGRRYIVDYTVEKVFDMLDHGTFYRISRKYIININAIKDIIQFTNSRLKLIMEGLTNEDVVVARERVQAFKHWLDR